MYTIGDGARGLLGAITMTMRNLIGVLAFLAITGAHEVLSVMILATLGYGVIGSVNAVLYLHTPEIYPTRLRALGTGAASAWLRVASALGPAIVGFTLAVHGTAGVFFLFAVIALAGAAVTAGATETRERRLEEISP